MRMSWIGSIIYAIMIVLAGVTMATSTEGCGGLRAPIHLGSVAKQDWYKTRVIKALDVIRDTAQDGNAVHKPDGSPFISTGTARKVTKWHRSTLVVMDAAGSGWQAAVEKALDELPSDLTPAEAQEFTPWIVAAKAILKEVTQ